ncbi:hypothetical protein M758_UG021900 [Ceratodon purpureus]|nr:hypothetical protein M758_UG021900 [Ceratodon purpureus]
MAVEDVQEWWISEQRARNLRRDREDFYAWQSLGPKKVRTSPDSNYDDFFPHPVNTISTSRTAQLPPTLSTPGPRTLVVVGTSLMEANTCDDVASISPTTSPTNKKAGVNLDSLLRSLGNERDTDSDG